MPPMPRYCLEDNPFPEVPLSPAEVPDRVELGGVPESESEFLAWVALDFRQAGMTEAEIDALDLTKVKAMLRKHLARLRNYLLERIRAGMPAMVLVAGANASGRTSAAQNVLGLYATLLKISELEHFLLPLVPKKDHTSVEAVREWVFRLWEKISNHGIVLPSDPPHSLEKELEEIITTAWKEEETESKLRVLLPKVARSLLGKGSEPRRGFGVYFDGIPGGSKLLNKVTTIFTSTPTVIVATEAITESKGGAEILDFFGPLENSGEAFVLRLRALDAKLALEFTRLYWKMNRPRSRCHDADVNCRLDEKINGDNPILDNWDDDPSPFQEDAWMKAWGDTVGKQRLVIGQLLLGLKYAMDFRLKPAPKTCWGWQRGWEFGYDALWEGFYVAIPKPMAAPRRRSRRATSRATQGATL